MDKILAMEAITLVLYTVIVLAKYYTTGYGEPSTLTACVFAACSVENGAMAFIQSRKAREGKNPPTDKSQTTEE